MLRRLIPRRLTALAATGVLATAGLVALSAPAAHAAAVTYPNQCVNQTLPSLAIPPATTSVDIQIEPAKASYAVGEQVTVWWKWQAYTNVPPNPFVDEVAEDSTLPFGLITVGGAQSTEVETVGERKNARTVEGDPLILTDMKAVLTLTNEGTVTFTPRRHSTSTLALGFDSETICEATAPQPVSASINVGPGQVELPTLDAADGEFKPGETVTLTGTKFAPNATPRVTLCDSAGLTCEKSRIAESALTINAQGDLSGTVKLATLATKLPEGTYRIRVYDGAKEATDTITVKPFVPIEPRTLVLSTSTGPVGTRVDFTGENWTPNTNVRVDELISGGGVQAGPTVTATPGGKISGTTFITNAGTIELRAREGISSIKRVILPFTVTPGQVGYQDVTVGLTAGGLTMSQSATGIDFGTVMMDGSAKTLNGALNQVTVVDARGSNDGWALVGTLTDLTAANGVNKIPAGNVSWTPACAKSADSLSDVTTGSAGPLGATAASLCSQAANPSAATGGRFTADAQLALTTPSFAAAGTYSGTLTLTLS